MAATTRWGLSIGANLTWLCWGLIGISFIIAWPISKLLDCLIGEEHRTHFRRAELKELMAKHGEKQQVVAGGGGGGGGATISSSNSSNNSSVPSTPTKRDVLRTPPTPIPTPSEKIIPKDTEILTYDEITIIKGALDMRNKTAIQASTPLDKIFMIDINTKIDRSLKEKIIENGRSRIPVYSGSREHIVGMLLTKSLIYQSEEQISKIGLKNIPKIASTLPLYSVLNLFKTGTSHLAVVVDDQNFTTSLGIITFEDVIEELIQEDILDESDVKRSSSSSYARQDEHLVDLQRGPVTDINAIYYAEDDEKNDIVGSDDNEDVELSV
eukprot:TRINITY_DN1896_c0_g2_i3.p1 TRINITY_DN1896_c0_g2~~TRINITY_DN1896_c0_g2_i3.p1  ORF type:complete len:325 (+),score=84.81 TRINITY_DN1896_c0_g2_i3:516-1490(+)